MQNSFIPWESEVWGVKLIQSLKAFVFEDVSSTSPGCIGKYSLMALIPSSISSISINLSKLVGLLFPKLKTLNGASDMDGFGFNLSKFK